MITMKELKLKLLGELRLDIYLKRNFRSNSQYEQGREDITRYHLTLLGYDKGKLMEVKDIDELLGVNK